MNVISTTEQWAGVAIAGPNSRNLLNKNFPNSDVSNEALPFMGFKKMIYLEYLQEFLEFHSQEN